MFQRDCGAEGCLEPFPYGSHWGKDDTSKHITKYLDLVQGLTDLSSSNRVNCSLSDPLMLRVQYPDTYPDIAESTHQGSNQFKSVGKEECEGVRMELSVID